MVMAVSDDCCKSKKSVDSLMSKRTIASYVRQKSILLIHKVMICTGTIYRDCNKKLESKFNLIPLLHARKNLQLVMRKLSFGKRVN